MLSYRVNSFNDVSLGEPEQDANSALTELDKGLRSSKIGEQCEAIVRFPRLFEKYPFPILINSSLLKLADVFRMGNNFLRLWVLRVCQQSEKHLDKILNVDEFVRRIFSVIHSNDPVARALTLRTLGSVAGIIPERQHVHHSIRRSLDSHDSVEVEAAIYAANQFASQSKTFALSMCNKMSDMIQGLTTPAHMKLQLIPILQHMHHDTSTAAMVQELCMDLLPKYPAQDFVPVILHTLTQLALATLVNVPKQVSLLLQHLKSDQRPVVRQEALHGLRLLAAECAHLWPSGTVEEVVQIADNSSSQAVLSRCLDVLQVLAKSSAACHSHLCHDSPLMELCNRTCYSSDPSIAAKAVQVITRIVCYSYKEEHTQDAISQAVDAVESLFLLITVGQSHKYLREMKTCLQCAVSLCTVNRQLCNNFVQLFGTRLMSGSCNSELCEALGAIGNLRPSALLSLIPDILLKLKELTCANSSMEQNQLKVMLCTLVFQSAVGFTWNPEATEVIKSVVKKNDQWANFRTMRAAARYGHHSISSPLAASLKDHVSSEHFHFWLVCLEELSFGEAQLHDIKGNACLESRISLASSHYCKAAAALKAASTPAHCLQFQSEFIRLRGEFLQLLAQVVHCCRSYCTAPPPAVAGSMATATRDDLLRFGHITPELRKCAKDLRACGEMYWKLYQSAFDADKCSLANIQILQQMCVLMAHSIERVVITNYQEETAFDCSLQECSLETQYMVKCCQEAAGLAQAIATIKEVKPVTHLHVDVVLRQAEILANTSLCIPRFFFQVLQSTSVKLAVSPQPRVMGENISVQGGSQLAVKVEGVIQHGKRPGLYRRVNRVIVSVNSQLQTRPNVQLDAKMAEAGAALSQTVIPHRDFFTAEFLMAFSVGGQYVLTIEASVIDEKGNAWRTGPRQTLSVRSHEETPKASNIQQGAANQSSSRVRY
ncbi:Integrator complex subunit 7 [Frankliniella fusca]|uniref:Integrator complex subunit 7 n=1 Tax=Frankliniella fusca TaxID=407009 RepID=A0AAE1HRA0_9NEOP|nr:Integrator complex subunit 7 [Frankliniella fusca]